MTTSSPMMLLIILAYMTSSVLCEYPSLIDGPTKLDDNICIVGANVAGIHMAVLLKQKGYTNITIYEKETVVGGSQTYMQSRRGENHDLGTGQMFTFDHFETLRALLVKYQGDISRDIVEPDVWVNSTTYYTFRNFVLMVARNHYGASNTDSQLISLLKVDIKRYQDLHKELLGTYDGVIFDEPSWQVKFQIYGTFEQFIDKNNFKALKPIFKYFFTWMGYGKLMDTAASYGLMICTPVTINEMYNMLDGIGLSKGYKYDWLNLQNLFQNMVTIENLNVIFNTQVTSLTRNARGVDVTANSAGTTKTNHFKFVIWSANLRKGLKYWKNPTNQEYQNFLHASQRYAVKTLVDTTDQRLSNSPIDFMLNPAEKSIASVFETYAVKQRYFGSIYTRRFYPTGNDGQNKKKTAVYTQYTDTEPTIAEMNTILQGELMQLGATSVEIIMTKIWPFFPHYSHQDLTNDMLYTILKMQGKNMMWYTGASVCFDSIPGILEYNKLLVSKMRAPTN